jgi:hypothetical protein
MTIIADPHAQKRKQFITLVMKYVKPGAGSGIAFLNKRTWTHPVTNLNNIIKQAPFVVVGGNEYLPKAVEDLESLIILGKLEQK